MKATIHFAAIVAITLFLASAFSKLVVDQRATHVRNADPYVAQVVITAEPLTLLEWVQYDVSTLAGRIDRSLHDKAQVASK